MEFLRSILENSQYSFITAFILGLMTAISPCPLATNITAIGFISRDIENQKRVFISGLVYTLGRAISYIALGIILFLGVSRLKISMIFQGWGEKLLGPVLIFIGLFMLDVIKLKLPGFSGLTDKIGERSKKSYWSTLLLGMVFAMAFCPYSGVLFFVMLVPLAIASISGLYLPVVFAVGTGLPVIIFAWLLAYAIGNVAHYYNKIKTFELWFRRSKRNCWESLDIYCGRHCRWCCRPWLRSRELYGAFDGTIHMVFRAFIHSYRSAALL